MSADDSICRVMTNYPAFPGNGHYIASFDAHDGPHGSVRLTPDKAKAQRAPAAYWLKSRNEINRNYPTRPDGKPNRPLSAFHLEIMKPDEEPFL